MGGCRRRDEREGLFEEGRGVTHIHYGQFGCRLLTGSLGGKEKKKNRGRCSSSLGYRILFIYEIGSPDMAQADPTTTVSDLGFFFLITVYLVFVASSTLLASFVSTLSFRQRANVHRHAICW